MTFQSTGSSLSDNERNIIRQFAESKGLGFSAALRYIIHEWAETRQAQVQQAQSNQSPTPQE